MSKRILFLGYKPYLSSVLYNLNNTPFFNENQVDVIFATSDNSKNLKALKKHIRQLNFRILFREFFVKANTFLFREKHKQILNSLFPEKDLSFLKAQKNCNVLPYSGLENIANLKDYDFMIVATFGIKIPESIFNAPKGRTLNIHPSLLPKLRGGYPAYVDAFQSNNVSGTTLHYMEKGWDNGDVVLQKTYDLPPESTNHDILKRSAVAAGDILNQLHKQAYAITAVKQEKAQVTYCHKVLKHKLFINEMQGDLDHFIRANYTKSLFPFTYGIYKGFLISLIRVRKVSSNQHYKRIRFYKKNNSLFLEHRQDLFEIEEYIFKGKHFKK